MIKRRWIWWAAACAALVVPVFAAAQRSCLPRDSMISHLAVTYGENVVAIGIAGNVSLVEILVNGESLTFSIISTDPRGTACLVMAGTGWRSMLDGEAI